MFSGCAYRAFGGFMVKQDAPTTKYTSGSDFQTCEESCTNDPACKTWTINPNTGECYTSVMMPDTNYPCSTDSTCIMLVKGNCIVVE